MSPQTQPSGGTHTALRRVPGAGCTMHRGTNRGSARHRCHKATLLPRQLPPQPCHGGDAGKGTPCQHGDPRVSPLVSLEGAGPLPPVLAAGWARASQPDVTTAAHVPLRCAMPRPGCTAMNSWPRNAHEAATANSPLTAAPAWGRRGTPCLLCPPTPRGITPVPASPGTPLRVSATETWCQPPCESHSTCPRRRVGVPRLPAPGIPATLVNHPFANAPLGCVLGPQPQSPSSGQRRPSCPGMMPDPP